MVGDLIQRRVRAEDLHRALGRRDRKHVAVFTHDILLLDEPLSALDKKLRAELRWELKQIPHRVGTTFIYVTTTRKRRCPFPTRSPSSATAASSSRGLRACFTSGPATRFVADFLGKSNFINGRVVAPDGDRFVYEVAGCRYVQTIAGVPRQVGDEIVVALRPEKVEIRKGPRPEDGANGISGEISAWNYHGTSFHVLVETDALGELIVTAPAWHSEVEPEVGRRVHLVWSADAAAGVVAPD